MAKIVEMYYRGSSLEAVLVDPSPVSCSFHVDSKTIRTPNCAGILLLCYVDVTKPLWGLARLGTDDKTIHQS
jgi:hypothetical protein